jgi:hypothetical protein
MHHIHLSPSANPELGFYPYLADVEYVLESGAGKPVKADPEIWRPYFDKGIRPGLAVQQHYDAGHRTY